jgi:hypothetical protein
MQLLASDLLFESIVVLATLQQTWSLVWEQHSLDIRKRSLAEAILHNGALIMLGIQGAQRGHVNGGPFSTDRRYLLLVGLHRLTRRMRL